MNTCIDCGVELTAENRSKHQSFRCLACFDIFANRVTHVLETMFAWPDNTIEEQETL